MMLVPGSPWLMVIVVMWNTPDDESSMWCVAFISVSCWVVLNSLKNGQIPIAIGLLCTEKIGCVARCAEHQHVQTGLLVVLGI